MLLLSARSLLIRAGGVKLAWTEADWKQIYEHINTNIIDSSEDENYALALACYLTGDRIDSVALEFKSLKISASV